MHLAVVASMFDGPEGISYDYVFDLTGEVNPERTAMVRFFLSSFPISMTLTRSLIHPCLSPHHPPIHSSPRGRPPPPPDPNQSHLPDRALNRPRGSQAQGESLRPAAAPVLRYARNEGAR
jgi:hypothetical protein